MQTLLFKTPKQENPVARSGLSFSAVLTVKTIIFYSLSKKIFVFSSFREVFTVNPFPLLKLSLTSLSVELYSTPTTLSIVCVSDTITLLSRP